MIVLSGDVRTSPQCSGKTVLAGSCCMAHVRLLPAAVGQARREEELRNAYTELSSIKAAQESSRTAVVELEALRREERTLQQKMHDLQHSLVRAAIGCPDAPCGDLLPKPTDVVFSVPGTGNQTRSCSTGRAKGQCSLLWNTAQTQEVCTPCGVGVCSWQ